MKDFRSETRAILYGLQRCSSTAVARAGKQLPRMSKDDRAAVLQALGIYGEICKCIYKGRKFRGRGAWQPKNM